MNNQLRRESAILFISLTAIFVAVLFGAPMNQEDDKVDNSASISLSNPASRPANDI